MTTPRVHRSELGFLVIDVQPAFLASAYPDQGPGHEALLVRLEHLLMLADWMELPVIYTLEKPVEMNGEIPERLKAVFPAHGQRFVKNYFGSLSEAPIRQAVESLPGRQIAVAGAETDVCVMQSVLGLLEMGFEVFLLEDCLFTSESEPAPALRRLMQAGAIPATLKMLAYELVACVDHTAWYPEILEAKSDPFGKPLPASFIPPEQWPAWKQTS